MNRYTQVSPVYNMQPHSQASEKKYEKKRLTITTRSLPYISQSIPSRISRGSSISRGALYVQEVQRSRGAMPQLRKQRCAPRALSRLNNRPSRVLHCSAPALIIPRALEWTFTRVPCGVTSPKRYTFARLTSLAPFPSSLFRTLC